MTAVTLMLMLMAQSATGLAQSVRPDLGLRTAQSPVNILLGYPAGGGGDAVLRVFAPALARELGRAVTVENRPGAAGLLALAALRRSKPDGSNLMMADTGLLIASVLQEPRQPSPLEFSPVAELGGLPYALVARSGLDVLSVSDLITLLRASPGRYTVATPGFGSMGHQAAERFERAAGVRLLAVPYKGGGPALADLATGRVDLAFVSLAAARIAASVGNARLLAITSLQRMPEVADLPSLSETLPGFEAVTGVFLVGPAGMTPTLVTALERAVLAATQRPAVGAALAQNGLLLAPAGTGPLRLKLEAQWRVLQLEHRRQALAPSAHH